MPSCWRLAFAFGVAVCRCFSACCWRFVVLALLAVWFCGSSGLSFMQLRRNGGFSFLERFADFFAFVCVCYHRLISFFAPPYCSSFIVFFCRAASAFV